MPEAARRAALDVLAPTAEQRGKMLMQIANENKFDPTQTAQAITPLLLDLSNEGVFAITEELNALLDSKSPGLRSAALALKVRSGDPLDALAKRDPQALLNAITAMSAEQVPASLPAALVDLAEAGQFDPGIAIMQANRLSTDKQILFKRLAALADQAMDLSFESFGTPHKLAMAALAGMHQTPDEDWPTGFDKYRIARADKQTLEVGKAIYFYHDQGCYKCHGERGEGTEGFPPIAGSPSLVGDPARAASIVKYGLQGELPHTLNPSDGNPFNAQMEPLSQFNDAELASALTYLRQSFGNFAPPVTVKDIQAARGPKADKGEGENMWKASALFAKYPFERDRLTGPLPPPAINIQAWVPPAFGLVLMLIVVGLAMLLILVCTYAGKFLSSPGPAIHA